MEFILQSPPTKKSGFTLGFLDENTHNEFHSHMMPGVFEAARKWNANNIRFSYYSYHSAYDYACQSKMILDLIRQYNLDGLLFLGWARAGAMHNEEFFKQFSSIPLLSIGAQFEGIPSVYAPGALYIQEIILHLIQVHQFRRIAYIAPMRPDERNQSYFKLMKEYGIYDPDLYISAEDLTLTPFAHRARRALEILLDERRVRFDAIMSMYPDEAANLLAELNERGFRVPRDVAVTTYEERDIAKYSSPGFTTVYFPWIELGFCGCMKLMELLTQGQIPYSTVVPGKVIYRNTCGCMSGSIVMAGKYQAPAADHTLDSITEEEQKKIVAEMEAVFPYAEFDFQILLEAFLSDYYTGRNAVFFAELASQLRTITYSNIHSNIKEMISVFRGLLLPYLLNDPPALLWSGNLFQQAQVMAWEKITNVYSSAKVTAKILSQALQEISQILITSFSTEELFDSLTKNLPKLQIPSCYIFLFNPVLDSEGVPQDLFEDCRLVFAYSNHTRRVAPYNGPATLKQTIMEILAAPESPPQETFPQDTSQRETFPPESSWRRGESSSQWEEASSTFFLTHLLHVTDEFMGFIMFEPGPVDQLLYQTLTTHISTALRGALLLEKLNASYQELTKQAHREGMADISIEILHNIGNILNSINVSVNLMKTNADSLMIPYLLNANEMLTANLADLETFITGDPKGKKLMQFFLKLGTSFADFKNQMIYNANRLDDKVKSIVDMISAQQTYAGAGNKEVMEKLDIASILDDAVKLMAESIDRYQIKITKDYQVRPQILVQRMKLFHILFKLINNAKDAMIDTQAGDRSLTFTICEDEQCKYIRISDSGRGIPGNLLEKIFEFGYSNKKDGHELGLHSCSKYMKEMDGKIWAESNSPNSGTTFVLQFK
jgi:DNA-binding LacI/PurR family transcriptional regulator/signal transduction histidine kinase